MPNAKEITALSRLPGMDIPYQTAEKNYGGQVAELMRKVQSSRAEGAKSLRPHEFKWRLVYDQAADPEHITDPQAFTAHLAAESKSWLKATGNKWIGYEEIHTTPDKIKQLYENRARAICNERLAQQRSEGEPEPEMCVEDYEEGDLELVRNLSVWCRFHPNHNKHIASIARMTLAALIDSVEED